jgi:O-succinylbenzoate synthase
MKIKRVTLTHVRVPLTEVFRISNGAIAEKDSILVGLEAGDLVGYGESSPMPGSFYSEDTPESCWSDLTERIVPALLATPDITHLSVHRLLSELPVGQFSRAGADTAVWDLEAQQQGIPLYRLLGGNRSSVECGLAVGITPTIQDLLNGIHKYLGEGYKRLKIKIQPGWDRAPLAAIRKEFGSLPLMVDANCAYTQDDMELLTSLDEFGLMMIEQPLPRHDLEGHARLQRVAKTPVCLDEGAEDVAAVKKAIALKACRIINIKIQRVGGFTGALTIHDLCRDAGIPVWGGTMPELGIGGIQTVHLATLSNFLYPTDVQSSARWFVEDVIEPLLKARDGMLSIPAGAGNCVALDRRVVKRYTVREKVMA